MREIPLSKGKFAIVDDEDFENVNQYKWYFEHGYARRDYKISNKRFRIYMHNFLSETPKGFHTDHINGNSLDNRRENLRVCSASQNCMNSKKNKKASSKYKGVSFFKRDQNWMASITLNRKDIYLGYFDREEDAAQAYNFAAMKHFGEYARLNVYGSNV